MRFCLIFFNSLLLSLCPLLANSASEDKHPNGSLNNSNSWYQQGDAWLTKKLSSLQHTQSAISSSDTAKNVILFVGDGMSISTLTASRIWQGQQKGLLGEEHFLSFEHFPHTALIKTYNSNQQTPDSAGSMTAMMTGVKTRAGMISIGPEQNRFECKGSEQYRLKTLLEWGSEHDFSTGIVTNTRLTHSTPAATYAHSPERDWEGDWDRFPNAYWYGCDSIAKQLMEQAFSSGLDLALGGGASRLQGYYEHFQQTFPNSQLIKNASDLLDLSLDVNNAPVLGVFAQSHMAYELDRLESIKNSSDDSITQPSLTTMTKKAIQYLQAREQGYLLVVEGGRIDHAHHKGNAARALVETASFSDAISQADSMTSDSDTLIIVTADHGHTMTMTGYPKRGNPILSISRNQKDEIVLAKDDRPFTTLGYANGRAFGRQVSLIESHDEHLKVSSEPSSEKASKQWTDTEDKDFKQGVAVKLELESHGGDDVALHAKGPGAYLFTGQMEQNEIFHTILQALTNLDAESNKEGSL